MRKRYCNLNSRCERISGHPGQCGYMNAGKLNYLDAARADKAMESESNTLTQIVTIRLTKQELERYKEIASQQRRSLSQWIRLILEQHGAMQ